MWRPPKHCLQPGGRPAFAGRRAASYARPVRRGPSLRGAFLAIAWATLVLLPAATAQTPNPTSVTIAGSLQSEAGCPSDWDPACAATHLTYDAGDDVWQRTFDLPADNYEYKAALNNAWDENYGLHATLNGPNIPLAAPGGTVKFYYDHKTHWVT